MARRGTPDRSARAVDRPVAWTPAALLAAALMLVACTTAPVKTLPAWSGDNRPVNPEAAGPGLATPALAAIPAAPYRHAVAAAHPAAAEAGRAVLREGGSALDAAIAAQAVLAVVEPQSSGLGGGAFLLHWDGQRLRAYDGRETAPAGADERLLLRPDGQALDFHEAAVGGRAVGVPGVVRMLEAAHRRHGRLPWARLFEPAIDLARDGAPVGPRLHALLAGDQHLRRDPRALAHFYRPDGTPWPVGTALRNPALAAVLQRLAAEGSTALHEGAVARSIAQAVQQHPANPGRLNEADLHGYRPVEREPLCSDWRAWRLCGFPPPSSGHLALGQILGLLAALPGDGTPTGPDDAEGWHRYLEAARLAWADRARHVGDPDHVEPPPGGWAALLAPDYLAERARLIGPRAMPTAPAGQPGGGAARLGLQAEQPEVGTTHLSIVDARGEAVALTSTIEDQFGARLMVDGGTGLPGGFLLNNQLTDFAFSPIDGEGRPLANRLAPGKRPRSSMSPTLVFDRSSGALALVSGSPGGALIIHYTAQSLLRTLGWQLPPAAALAQPHLGSLGGPVLLEAGGHPPTRAEALRGRGHTVREVPMTSGVHLLQRVEGGWRGAADPRREGAVRGD